MGCPDCMYPKIAVGLIGMCQVGCSMRGSCRAVWVLAGAQRGAHAVPTALAGNALGLFHSAPCLGFLHEAPGGAGRCAPIPSAAALHWAQHGSPLPKNTSSILSPISSSTHLILSIPAHSAASSLSSQLLRPIFPCIIPSHFPQQAAAGLVCTCPHPSCTAGSSLLPTPPSLLCMHQNKAAVISLWRHCTMEAVWPCFAQPHT